VVNNLQRAERIMLMQLSEGKNSIFGNLVAMLPEGLTAKT
jgi:hypothetical protein